MHLLGSALIAASLLSTSTSYSVSGLVLSITLLSLVSGWFDITLNATLFAIPSFVVISTSFESFNALSLMYLSNSLLTSNSLIYLVLLVGLSSLVVLVLLLVNLSLVFEYVVISTVSSLGILLVTFYLVSTYGFLCLDDLTVLSIVSLLLTLLLLLLVGLFPYSVWYVFVYHHLPYTTFLYYSIPFKLLGLLVLVLCSPLLNETILLTSSILTALLSLVIMLATGVSRLYLVFGSLLSYTLLLISQDPLIVFMGSLAVMSYQIPLYALTVPSSSLHIAVPYWLRAVLVASVIGLPVTFMFGTKFMVFARHPLSLMVYTFTVVSSVAYLTLLEFGVRQVNLLYGKVQCNSLYSISFLTTTSLLGLTII